MTSADDHTDAGRQRRIWRLTGFDERGVLVEIEIPEPDSETDTTPFRPSIVIGRDPDHCDCAVQEPTVSRVHAEFRFFRDEGLFIRDLDSTNGTYVDGHEVNADYYPLRSGSEIELGKFVLSISIRH
ncbi:MAG: FHA domain-containing protein [Alphaproteobacteria bacterium]|nr:MAG: FHA domain-containing protein [Alphaproteobacteria bacterium]